MSKIIGSTTTRAAWDLSGSLPLQLVDGSTDYIYGPRGMVLEQISGSTTLWYHHDQIGSVRAVTDTLGNVKATYTFDAYGNVLACTGATVTVAGSNICTGTITVSNPFDFSGQYRDDESGLYYLRARYYDPPTGQFLSRDPAISLTRSSYGYVAGNPLNATDPSGLFAVGVCGTGTLGINGLGPVGAAASGAHCDVVAWGPHGVQVGVIDTIGGGPGAFGGHFASGSKSVLISPTAQTVNDLGGRFQYVSGGFGFPVGPFGLGAEASYAWGTNSCGQAQSVYSFGPSASFPFGASATGGVSITFVHRGSLGALSDILQQFNELVRDLGL